MTTSKVKRMHFTYLHHNLQNDNIFSTLKVGSLGSPIINEDVKLIIGYFIIDQLDLDQVLDMWVKA